MEVYAIPPSLELQCANKTHTKHFVQSRKRNRQAPKTWPTAIDGLVDDFRVLNALVE